ncbi:MAG: ATP-binding cassette domain-containing protein [Microbacterium sp.]|nr:ATP-binding cassette domain-containing protein [Microbacterium sp.]
MTASLPQPPESAPASSEDDAASVDAAPTAKPRVSKPRAPRRPASSAAAVADESGGDDTPTTPKSASRGASSPRSASTTSSPRSPRPTAAKKPAAPGAAAEKTPAAPRSSTAKKPATPRATGEKKPAAPRAAAAKKPATPRTPAAKKPATPRTPAAKPTGVETSPVVPGPPPPLPDDLVVPPRPPLPSVVQLGAVPAPVAADPTPADVAVEEPVVAEPTTEPVSEESAPEVPVSEELAAEPNVGSTGLASHEPDDSDSTISQDPTPADAPVEARVVEEPVVEEPVVEEPVVEEPAVEELIVEEPVIEEPAAEQPVIAEPEVSDGGSSDAASSVVAVEAPGADAGVPALRLRSVTKTFGEVRAVDGIDLTVPAGSFYGLVGPNGAGKTTTLSIIAGLLRSDGGTVEINGIDAARQSRAAKKLIGVLPDRLRTFDRLTGRQLLSYYGALRGLPAPVVESRAADLARAFDLVEALGRPVSDYSAGMTKKVMLAGAMIHSPRLLVLDEPFEAVDPVSSAVILDILRAYVDHGGTVILSSHGMELVERVCSRVAVIVSGQVLAEGTVDEVRGGSTLEERFLELAGGLGDVEGLEWLHTFSA